MNIFIHKFWQKLKPIHQIVNGGDLGSNRNVQFPELFTLKLKLKKAFMMNPLDPATH